MRSELNGGCMTNYGQIERKIRIKKRYVLSPFVLNLSDEAKQWAKLTKRLRKRIRRYGTG